MPRFAIALPDIVIPVADRGVERAGSVPSTSEVSRKPVAENSAPIVRLIPWENPPVDFALMVLPAPRSIFAPALSARIPTACRPSALTSISRAFAFTPLPSRYKPIALVFKIRVSTSLYVMVVPVPRWFSFPFFR